MRFKKRWNIFWIIFLWIISRLRIFIQIRIFVKENELSRQRLQFPIYFLISRFISFFFFLILLLKFPIYEKVLLCTIIVREI